MTQPINFTQRINSILFGIALPFVSAKLILSKPKLLLFSIIPLVITFVFYWYGISYIHDFLQSYLNNIFLDRGYDPHGWLAKTLLWVTQIFLFILSALTFSFVSSILSCPFNDFLAEQTEVYSHPPLRKISRVSLLTRLELITIDFIKVGVAGFLNLLILALSWIPVINFLSLIATFLLISFQYISYPQTRRKEGVIQGLRFLRKHFYSCIGFGAALTFLFSLPLLSILVLPIAVVGGTLLFARAKALAPLPPLR